MLKYVTITGADDNSNLEKMAQLTREFPFIEWAILVSKNSEGHPRFPSRRWIDEFVNWARLEKWNVSMHVCGRWVREMLTGDLDWLQLPPLLEFAQRIQINTHAQSHVSTTGFIRSLGEAKAISTVDPQFIFQWDGVNNHLLFPAKAYDFNVAALYDTSHGAGETPASWPQASNQFMCGFAGGLGPDNIATQLPLIRKAATWPGTNIELDYWIDMERNVRSEDDSRLDMRKVRSVMLQVCELIPAKVQ